MLIPPDIEVTSYTANSSADGTHNQHCPRCFSPGPIRYADLAGSNNEMLARSRVSALLKHHGVLNGVLTADLVSMILALPKK